MRPSGGLESSSETSNSTMPRSTPSDLKGDSHLFIEIAGFATRGLEKSVLSSLCQKNIQQSSLQQHPI